MHNIDIRVITKIISIGCAALIIGVSVYTLVDLFTKNDKTWNVNYYILPFNYIVMSLLLVASEFDLDIIKRDFLFIA